MTPEELQQQFDAAAAQARSLKAQYAQCTQYLGQIDAVLNATKPYWVNLATNVPSEDAAPILVSGSAVIKEINASLNAVNSAYAKPVADLRSISLSASAFGSNTAATSYALPEIKGPFRFDVKIIPKTDYLNNDDLAGRLGKLDPALAAVSREIWECLYGTVSDPERSALYMMRQTWDHLFGILAPDNDVRGSKFFVPKEDDVVTREERLRYAAATKIKDPNDQARLEAVAKQMLDLYQALNRAHKRGPMDRQKAITSLHALYDFLNQWADALEKSS